MTAGGKIATTRVVGPTVTPTSTTPAPSTPSTAGAKRKPHVVIIGSGFGGLFAARALRRANVEVTLIAKTRVIAIFPPAVTCAQPHAGGRAGQSGSLDTRHTPRARRD